MDHPACPQETKQRTPAALIAGPKPRAGRKLRATEKNRQMKIDARAAQATESTEALERLAKNSSREAKSAARKSNPVKENRIRKISDFATPKNAQHN
jgi:hypothetical protein